MFNALVIPLFAFFTVLLLALLGLLAKFYNRLIRLQKRYENAYSQIDVQLKRRYDLIPNLVEAAKAYLTHERQTLDEVISARNQASAAAAQAAANPGSVQATASLSGAEAGLGAALGRLMAVVEAYPDLKANNTIADLMEDLRSTENKVAFARQAFNDFATEYNMYRLSIPAVFIAPTLGFKEAALFEIDIEEERKAPKVSLT